jgi:competence protein ComEA
MMTVSHDAETEVPDNLISMRHKVRVESRIYLVIVAAVSLLIGGIMGRYLFRDNAADANEETTQPTVLLRQNTIEIPAILSEKAEFYVYVSGAVHNSKVVTVSEGSLVSDAINAAGGATSKADLESINLAAPVRNYDHIIVPQKNEPDTADRLGILDINTATAAELEVLPNIGPARAKQIVAYRESQGPFKNKQDIMNVSGIGQAIYEDLAPYIFVSGD